MEARFRRSCTRLPPTLAAVKNPGQRLLITEGCLKAIAASQAGVPCISLQGTWGWVVGKTDPKQLIESVAAIDWSRREVGLVYDSDPWRNAGVTDGFVQLANALTDLGADVRLLRLPLGTPDKMGASRPNKPSTITSSGMAKSVSVSGSKSRCGRRRPG